jgi:hypothetical protein
VRAFLDAKLAADPEQRAAADRYLRETLPAELTDVRVTSPSQASVR